MNTNQKPSCPKTAILTDTYILSTTSGEDYPKYEGKEYCNSDWLDSCNSGGDDRAMDTIAETITEESMESTTEATTGNMKMTALNYMVAEEGGLFPRFLCESFA